MDEDRLVAVRDAALKLANKPSDYQTQLTLKTLVHKFVTSFEEAEKTLRASFDELTKKVGEVKTSMQKLHALPYNTSDENQTPEAILKNQALFAKLDSDLKTLDGLSFDEKSISDMFSQFGVTIDQMKQFLAKADNRAAPWKELAEQLAAA